MITEGFNELLDQLIADRELVNEFFLVFSRFEYALKRVGCVKSDDAKKVEADWKKFGGRINDAFKSDATDELKEAVQYLKNNAPQTQYITHGQLDWRQTKPGTDDDVEIKWLLHLACTVRNNLFHGGKYPDTSRYDVGRDVKLLQSCLILLNACLELDGDVRHHFWTPPA